VFNYAEENEGGKESRASDQIEDEKTKGCREEKVDSICRRTRCDKTGGKKRGSKEV